MNQGTLAYDQENQTFGFISKCLGNNLNLLFRQHARAARASQVALLVKNLPANAENVRDAGLILGSGRYPGRGHSNSFQYSCLEECHVQRSLAGYSPQHCKESDITEATQHACMHESCSVYTHYSDVNLAACLNVILANLKCIYNIFYHLSLV